MDIGKKIATSWELVKTALFYIKRDSELFIYSLLSVFVTFILFALFWVIIFVTGIFNFEQLSTISEDFLQGIFLLIGIAYALMASFIRYFFNAAIASSVERRLQWDDNTFWDGIRSAFGKIGPIFIWSTAETFVFWLIDQIYKRLQKLPFIGAIVKSMLTAAWNIMTYFSFNLMVLGNRGLVESMKISAQLFQKSWGERATVFVGAAFVFGFIRFLLTLIFLAFAIAFFNPENIIPFFVIIFMFYFCWVIISVFKHTCETIIRVLMMYYAITGKLPEALTTVDIAKISEK